MIIKEARLIDNSELGFGDFNVFIGGNGVGKTTVLTEIFSKFSETARTKYYWIDKLSFSSVNANEDMKLVKSTLQITYEGANKVYYSPAVKNIHGDIAANDGGLRFSQNEFNEMDSIVDMGKMNTEMRYRRPFLSFMSCEARLNLFNSIGITGLQNPPTDPINVLFRDKVLLKNIADKVLQRFGYELILLNHSDANLELGLSKKSLPTIDPEGGRMENFHIVESWKDGNFIPIIEAGHGIRSMIRLLISILDPINKIILIDEPEIHLYPKHKRWLGKELVSLAKKQNKQIFLVTHDPMILQGVLDATTTTRIFRVDKDHEGKGLIQSCDFDAITKAGVIKNQEQYLQGLFYQRCIVVEGASDRSFYSNMFDDYPELEDKDLGFVVSGGVGNSKHIAEMISKVGLKASFIFDQDVLFSDPHVLSDLYAILGGAEKPLEILEKSINKNKTIAMEKNHEKRWKLIKKHIKYSHKEGIDPKWKSANKKVFNETINKLADKGIFFVPKGSLESWAPSVDDKKRFAELAPALLRSDMGLQKDLKKFAQEVVKYIDIEVK